jgi:SAM-dependent methyltransferase
MGDLFDAAAMYDEDYLHFFAAPDDRSELASHGPVVPGADLPGEAAAELAWRLAELRPGMSVLDLACGHGELANRLAARGCQVTGLDSSAVFLDRARADAAAAGVSADYVAGDMRQLPWTGRFDRVLNWSTAFGYFDDTTNRAVLDGIARVLRPAGRLAMDLDNLMAFLASYLRAIRSPGRSSRDVSGPRRRPAPFRFSDGASTIGVSGRRRGPGAGSAEGSTGIGRAGRRAG